ncbi:hypothetical protein K9N68_04750 [Kovacikia minuta CCNUW1]|uniref:hypothetical protein n=1 Tax=Kovacikia minuta TaxID=2931930 RepID=UPI001CCB1230|nr:hypothetical protein [Kovacikia minuta]UBF27276.1 hypothetical protein K9N68_04750 [Kovacikia minuta CCNUW1]
MTSEDTEVFIRSVLGDEALQPVTLTVNERSWQGWQKKRLKEALFKESDLFEAYSKWIGDKSLVDRFWLSFHARNIRIWTNGTFSLIAVPEMPVLEIPKCERVGAYDQGGVEETTTEEVQNLVAEIYNQCPFEILFASSASLNAAFLEPVVRQQAETFARLINMVAPETKNMWLGGMFNDGEIEVDENHMPKGNIQTLADCIHQKQFFCLYWY